MKLAQNRLDPSLLSPAEKEAVEQINALAQQEERPALIGREGVRIELPDAIFHHLVRVIRSMRQGQAIVLLPEREAYTTQAAADFLGVSRPFLIRLLEAGEIPYHSTGTHRRIYLKDLLDYMKQRDKKRRATLDTLASEVEAAGLYDKAVPPDDAR